MKEILVKNKKFLVISLAVLGGFLVLYFLRGEIFGGFKRLNLVRTNEPFTELYFETPDSLPKRTVAGKVETFTFTIHNMEGRTITYPYEVYFENSRGVKFNFEKGSFPIVDGEYATKEISRKFAASDQKGTVVVRLTELDQQIHFLLPNNN